jgi:hypothetical protein
LPQVGNVTTSVGFTRLRLMDNASGAVDRAERAVCHAKHNGRNQAHSYEALVKEGVIEEVNNSGEIELF